MYVGQAERSMYIRVQDHLSSFYKKNPSKLVFASRLLNESHESGDKARLHCEASNTKRLAVEYIEMKCHKKRHEVNHLSLITKLLKKCLVPLRFIWKLLCNLVYILLGCIMYSFSVDD